MMVRLTLARYGQGAIIAVRGSAASRRAYRGAGFHVVNDNFSARVARAVLHL
jgi:hypothetical protein